MISPEGSTLFISYFNSFCLNSCILAGLFCNGGTPLRKAGMMSTSLGTTPLLIRLYSPLYISDSVMATGSANGLFRISGGNTCAGFDTLPIFMRFAIGSAAAVARW